MWALVHLINGGLDLIKHRVCVLVHHLHSAERRAPQNEVVAWESCGAVAASSHPSPASSQQLARSCRRPAPKRRSAPRGTCGAG